MLGGMLFLFLFDFVMMLCIKYPIFICLFFKCWFFVNNEKVIRMQKFKFKNGISFWFSFAMAENLKN